jgi:L-sorbose 1-phosphate reductase
MSDMQNIPATLPATQCAIQLVGPDRLVFNRNKAVARPGPRQILARIEAVGLCFSDLKLLKRFADHPRKGPIVAGLSHDELKEMPNYVPGDLPTVPGHEVVCRIVAAGDDVRHHRVGERCLVQTDYRHLRTAGSNAAFGYNFEGALQEYVLMDERVIIDPADGERFLTPVSEDLGASAVALVEPWACVENSYASLERRTIRPGGRLLIVSADAARRAVPPSLPWSPDGRPAEVTLVSPADVPPLAAAAFDDILYFGADPAVIEALNDKLAGGGIMNIVLCDRQIGRPVSVGVGRVHYGHTRWIGTAGSDAADSYRTIPATGELRPGDRAAIIGAGGPMGQMHVMRAMACGVADLEIIATDIDASRLASLGRVAGPLAEARSIAWRLQNTALEPLAGNFDYVAILVPSAALAAEAVNRLAPGGLINVFAGIPESTRQAIDLDRYIAQRGFMFGTSGSVVADMKTVLGRMAAGYIDTDCSVEAVTGMAGAAAGMAAVENRTLSGKVIVYPSLHELGLTPLAEIPGRFPTVAALMTGGRWCRAAEKELLAVAGAM